MKLAPHFPALRSIAETVSFIGVYIGGVEMTRHPRFGMALTIASIVLFAISKLSGLKTKPAVKPESYHIT